MKFISKRMFIYLLVAAGFLTVAISGCRMPGEWQHAEADNEVRNDGETMASKIEYEEVELMDKVGFREKMGMYWEFFFRKGEKVPVSELPQEEVDLRRLQGEVGGIKSAWLGHSTLLLNIEGNLVLTDPVLERKVSIIGPTRFQKKLVLTAEQVPMLAAVIISHDHYDHLNAYSVKALADKTPLFLVPRGVGERLRQWGIAEQKIVELQWWQTHQVNEQLSITATPSQHFSGRGLFDRNRNLWASWVLQGQKTKAFFSGDSGYFSGFKEIGYQYGPFDVAFIECGAYSQYWSKVHMFPEQTVQAAQDLHARVLQPIHWGTFNLALHPWYEPVERLTTAAWDRSVRIAVPMIGEVVDYRRTLRTWPWWQPAMQESMVAAGRGVPPEEIMVN